MQIEELYKAWGNPVLPVSLKRQITEYKKTEDTVLLSKLKQELEPYCVNVAYLYDQAFCRLECKESLDLYLVKKIKELNEKDHIAIAWGIKHGLPNPYGFKVSKISTNVTNRLLNIINEFGAVNMPFVINMDEFQVA